MTRTVDALVGWKSFDRAESDESRIGQRAQCLSFSLCHSFCLTCLKLQSSSWQREKEKEEEGNTERGTTTKVAMTFASQAGHKWLMESVLNDLCHETLFMKGDRDQIQTSKSMKLTAANINEERERASCLFEAIVDAILSCLCSWDVLSVFSLLQFTRAYASTTCTSMVFTCIAKFNLIPLFLSCNFDFPLVILSPWFLWGICYWRCGHNSGPLK